eukprot:GILK01004524.1.p1 GENE.GILK01004524.1~~GILK01004524.1.p1  ORF type:complete len:343 (-),score=56.17 GILK01004524.1:116-1144(-)
MKKKSMLTLDDDTIDEQMAKNQSVIFGPENVNFLKQAIAIGKEGIIDEGQGGNLIRLEPSELQIGETLGRGASSYVQRAIHKSTGIELALKVINVFDRAKRQQMLNDVKALVGSDCPFLVKFYGAFYQEDTIKVALEFMDAGSLADVLKPLRGKPEPVLPEAVLSKMIQQVLQGFIYLHKVRHQVHRDIKLENILINTGGAVKLTDFGISRELNNTAGLAHTFVGTLTYMSPERILGGSYNYSSDVWSLGMIVVELAQGRYPYKSAKNYLEVVENVVNGQEPRLAEPAYSAELCDFVTKCLQKDPAARASPVALAAHPFITMYSEAEGDVCSWVRDIKSATP